VYGRETAGAFLSGRAVSKLYDEEAEVAQVRSHAGGSLASGKDSDSFFQRGEPFGANLGSFAFTASDETGVFWDGSSDATRCRLRMPLVSGPSFSRVIAPRRQDGDKPGQR
jgi:hypothetical protein